LNRNPHWKRISLKLILLAWVVVSMQACTIGRITLRNVPPAFHHPIVVQKLNRSDVPAGTRLSATWLGHSTVLLQMDDVYILTDPILTGSVGGVSKRLIEVGMDMNEIPSLDAVLISHRHFDHLSPASLAMLGSRVHTVLVPPKVTPDLPINRYRIVELLPWQAYNTAELSIVAVPVDHAGDRILDASSHPHSFTGFLIRYHDLSVYYPGDTAFRRNIFTQVQERFGPVDLAILPIGPIEPIRFMQKTHMNPAQAVDAAQLLQARAMVPVHFETFVNSLDGPTEDRDDLQAAELHLQGGLKVLTWRVGQSVVITPR
jgi:N-acyl-phosphatidylethanolamine-hydrolysing phospholipase D